MPATKIKMAVAQMQVGSDLEKNLATIESCVQEAAKNQADWIVLPEMATGMGKIKDWLAWIPRHDELISFLGGLAKENGIGILGGSLRKGTPAGSKGRYWNTLPVFNARGEFLAEYEKIHLFRAKLADRDYDESIESAPGGKVIVCEGGGFTWGLSICFDLRFPELFRSLRKKGADVFALPSAFTMATGKAHWHLLARARAVENQAFMVASDQVGKSGDGSEKYGHSLVVSPWGDVLLDMGQDEGVGYAELDLAEIETVRQKIDLELCMRRDLFPIG